MPFEPLLPYDLPISIGRLPHHVAVDPAAGGIVDDDIAFSANELIDAPINIRIARGLVVRPPRVHRHDARSRVVAAVNIVGDLLRLRRQIGILFLASHPAGRRDGNDNLACFHDTSLAFFRRGTRAPPADCVKRYGQEFYTSWHEGQASIDASTSAP